LPVETKVRELSGKVFLACIAVTNGFDAVIGSKEGVNLAIPFFNKGIVLGFGLAEGFADNFEKIKKYGHKIISTDEEGLVTLNDELYLKHRVSEKTLNFTDIFCCWGEKQKSLIESKRNKNNCKILTVGNPRFDMLRIENRNFFNNDVEKIKKKYGKFILVNTNFGHANHFSGEKFVLESLRKKGWMSNSADRDYFIRRIKWQNKILDEFLKIIPDISKEFREHKIIIRPHPSENHEIWEKIEKKFPNVSVIHSGNVIPWIIAAEALIHNGCTTAIEAFLLKTKVVSYRPVIINDLESDLPNRISHQATGSEEMINVLRKILKEDYDPEYPQKKIILKKYLSGMDGEFASEKIIKILKLYAKPSIRPATFFLLPVFNKCIKIKKNIKRLIFGLKPNAYALHKFSNTSVGEIRGMVEKFSSIDDRFSNIKVREISSEAFYIYEEK